MSIIQVENVWLCSQPAHLKTHSGEKLNNVDCPGGECLAKLSAGSQPEFQCSGAQVKIPLRIFPKLTFQTICLMISLMICLQKTENHSFAGFSRTFAHFSFFASSLGCFPTNFNGIFPFPGILAVFSRYFPGIS